MDPKSDDAPMVIGKEVELMALGWCIFKCDTQFHSKHDLLKHLQMHMSSTKGLNMSKADSAIRSLDNFQINAADMNYINKDQCNICREQRANK